MNNKLYILLVGGMLISAIILFHRISSLRKIPDTKTFYIQLTILNKTAQTLEISCSKHYKRVKERSTHPNNSDIISAMAAMDGIVSFEDSADFYFLRLKSFKNDPDSARQCFAKYAGFSNRFTAAIHKATTVDMQNYLLTMHERLPTGELPFESEEGIELLTALLQIEFYDRMFRAMKVVVDFTG